MAWYEIIAEFTVEGGFTHEETLAVGTIKEARAALDRFVKRFSPGGEMAGHLPCLIYVRQHIRLDSSPDKPRRWRVLPALTRRLRA